MVDNKSTNILSIETTDKSGSVALLAGDRLFERVLPESQRSATALAPAMNELLTESKLLPTDIGKVAVIIGPGSFTGLRVGLVTAKMFAYAVDAEIIGLSTFEVIAFNAFLLNVSGLLSIGVDAQRGEVVIQDWNLESGKYSCLSEMLILSANDWFDRVSESGQGFMFTGPALRRYGSRRLPNVKISDENLFEPRASVAAMLAKDRIPKSDIWSIVPIYSRPSAADEKLNSK
jgi:tRNA threonylcarbamoyladenosine biosynthesis protein TsaB